MAMIAGMCYTRDTATLGISRIAARFVARRFHRRAVLFFGDLHDIDCHPAPEGVSMFARLTKCNLKPNHTADFTKTYDEKVIPMLRKEKGFHDALLLKGLNSAEMVSITLWDHKEDAEAYSAVTYPEVLKVLANVLESAPYVKTYEVSSSTIATIAIPAAV
jgi:heme-degrading monooxygenase HmoA